MKKYAAFVSLAALLLFAFAPAEIFPKKINPLALPLYLSGNFGEPRTGHFHTGLDIKTNQKTGFPVFAIADGWISRIKISSVGYGKAVYITHANGYTSVYAHLSKLQGAVATAVEKKQYEQQSFEVDVYFEKNALQVSMGDTIALSGNSGGSGGPHLHFELRDAAEHAINPQGNGYLLADTLRPVFSGLQMYRMDDMRHNANSVEVPVSGGKGIYVSKNPLVYTNVRRIAFSANAWDIMNGSSNHVGVYNLKMYLDNALMYEFKTDKLSFDQGRSWGAHIDYRLKQVTGNNFHRLHTLPAENLIPNVQQKNHGILYLADDAIHTVQIIAADVAGNTSYLTFQIQFDAASSMFPSFITEFSQEFYPFQENNYQSAGLKLQVPKGVLFDTLLFNHTADTSVSAGVYSLLHHLHKDEVYLFTYMNVSVQCTNLPTDKAQKAVLVYKDYDRKITCLNGTYADGYVTARSRSFGDYYVLVDDKPPVITPVNISSGKTMTTLKTIRVKIDDNLSGIDSYKATIDGKWWLMEYDAKNDLLEGELANISSGEHSLKITVSDKRSNSSSYIVTFTR